MTFIHHATQQMRLKILYVGAEQSGKTQNLLSLGRFFDRKLEFGESDEALFFELLVLPFEPIFPYQVELNLYSFGVSEVFSTLQAFLLKGLNGVVFVADSQKEQVKKSIQAFDLFRVQLQKIGVEIHSLPLVFQYNHQDKASVFSHQEMDQIFNAAGHSSVSSVASQGKGVKESFDVLMRSVILNLKNPSSF
jgi:signal recognition particle receptor subunit beta